MIGANDARAGTEHAPGRICNGWAASLSATVRDGLVAGAAMLGLLAMPQQSWAQITTDGAEMPVVLELYTSQGCSACPPADQMLAAIASREDVIALALHVDYWDYIGWADSFAQPEFGERQKRIARRHGMNTVYTPQVVIDGVEILEGFRVMAIMDLIEDRRTQSRDFALSLTRGADGGLQIEAAFGNQDSDLLASRAAGRGLGTLAATAEEAGHEGLHDVQLIRYRSRDEVEITAGENAGLMAEYVNIVTSWQTVASWDPRLPLSISVPVEGSEPVVVIVQAARQGPIVAAARLR